MRSRILFFFFRGRLQQVRRVTLETWIFLSPLRHAKQERRKLFHSLLSLFLSLSFSLDGISYRIYKPAWLTHFSRVTHKSKLFACFYTVMNEKFSLSRRNQAPYRAEMYIILSHKSIIKIQSMPSNEPNNISKESNFNNAPLTFSDIRKSRDVCDLGPISYK